MQCHLQTAVEIIPLRGKRRVPLLRLALGFLKCPLQLRQAPFEFGAHLRLRGVLRLRCPSRIRQFVFRFREPALEILHDGPQRPFLLARPAPGIRHRLLKLRDTALDLGLLLQERSALLVRGMRGFGKRLLARCDFCIRAREFLAHFLEFRREALLRLLVPDLQRCQPVLMLRALGSKPRLNFPAEVLDLGKLRLRLPSL